MQQDGSNGQVSIQLLPKVSEYLSLIMSLIFAFGLVFQLPVILTTARARVGIIDGEWSEGKASKYAIVIAFVVAAVLTPPDPVSQIGLALPMPSFSTRFPSTRPDSSSGNGRATKLRARTRRRNRSLARNDAGVVQPSAFPVYSMRRCIPQRWHGRNDHA